MSVRQLVNRINEPPTDSGTSKKESLGQTVFRQTLFKVDGAALWMLETWWPGYPGPCFPVRPSNPDSLFLTHLTILLSATGGCFASLGHPYWQDEDKFSNKGFHPFQEVMS